LRQLWKVKDESTRVGKENLQELQGGAAARRRAHLMLKSAA
jgi:hypothetical protein